MRDSAPLCNRPVNEFLVRTAFDVEDKFFVDARLRVPAVEVLQQAARVPSNSSTPFVYLLRPSAVSPSATFSIPGPPSPSQPMRLCTVHVHVFAFLRMLIFSCKFILYVQYMYEYFVYEVLLCLSISLLVFFYCIE